VNDIAEPVFEIRVRGTLGPAARNAFADLDLEVQPTSTVISGEFTQEELHLVLDRVGALMLELVEVRQSPGDAAR
jgi:hypothetical protein